MTAPRDPAAPPSAPAPIGRERELARVEAILNRPEVALLTLTGPGGVGKTRLAREVARRLAPRFSGGAVFVNLAPVADARGVMAAVARACGVQESGRPTPEALHDAVRGRNLLLVLDNFEHVLDAAPDVSALLAGAPDLTVLATSRARLRLYGEHEFAVPPLPVDGEGGEDAPAVRLFVERAAAVSPGFAPGPGERAVLAEICRRLDGLPLAIELAAARVRLLPPDALLALLADPLRLLTGGARDLHERQRTLRATIDWSFDLLPEEERRLLARLGVFVGGWTIEAAEAVVGEGVDVLGGLASLVENSLVVRVDGPGGEARLTMLETLREYAREKLASSGEAEAVLDRHAAHFLALADEAGRGTRGPAQRAWIARLAPDQPNLLAALRRLADTGRLSDAARLVWALGWAWVIATEFGALRIMEALLARPELPPADRARVLTMRNGMQLRLGGMRADDLEDGLARLAGPEAGVMGAYLRFSLGLARIPAGAAVAQPHFDAALEGARSFRDAWLELNVLLFVVWMELLQGRPDRAQARLDETGPVARAVGDPELLSSFHMAQGLTHMLRGEPELAARGFAEGLRGDPRTRAPNSVAIGVEYFAALAAHERRDRRAMRLWGAAEALRRERNLSAGMEHIMRGPFLDPARARLDPAERDALLEEGRAMGLDAALDLALNRPDDGDDPVGGAARGGRPDAAPVEDPLTRLTPRETEVLRLLAGGLSNKRIAAQLGLGVYTVNDHVSSIFSKLGVPNRAAATRAALEAGLA